MSMHPLGYMGKILEIDLGSSTATQRDLGDDLPRRFMGGRGFGAKILYDGLAPGTDALSPDNLMVLATGPLTGTTAPGSKLEIIAKSPLTGGYADSAVGGHIGPEIKYAGHDAIVIKGKCRQPTYLWINNDRVEFRDASHLWGKGCVETEQSLKREFGQKAQILCIGPAGEHLVKIACITHASGRQAGRCGMGAVMGSKNLKAIVVRGDRGIRLADPKAFQRKAMQLRQKVLDSPDAMDMHRLGTSASFISHNLVGCLPTRNYQTGYFEQAEALSGETLEHSIFVRHGACFGCTLACAKWTRAEGVCIDGPEYETTAMLGSDCGIGRLEAVVKANYLCDDLGIDTISGGNVMAFATECYERGIIGDKETGGLALRFGDEQAFYRLIHMIANREGIGDTLAEGVREAARRFGKGSEKFAMHSKGLEQSAYETRAAIAQTLAYSINDRGADHNRTWSFKFFTDDPRSPEGKAAKVKRNQCERSSPDIMGMCRFVSYHLTFDDYGELITAATGAKTTGNQILEAAERVFCLTRLFNTREGFTRENDHVPPRDLEDPVPNGPAKGAVVKREDYQRMRDEFYALSGWDKDGIPTEAKLKEMALEDIAIGFRPFRKNAQG
jgi:aldehyde:ferredoxin oxidoreductase